MTQSPEVETLDQLLGGDMPLALVRTFFPAGDAFERGVMGLLSSGDVRLIGPDGKEVARWQWREVFGAPVVPTGIRLEITDQGARKLS